MTDIYAVIGPPGTGKTTYLANEIRDKAARYGPSEILVTSFTKAAAYEIANRDIPLPKENVGTLHSLCWWKVGEPKIADTPEGIAKWNDAMPVQRRLKNRGSHDPLSPMSTDETAAFQAYMRFRNQLVPRELWPPRVQDFARRWEDWKKQTGTVDFTEVIEQGIEDLPFAPGLPSIMYVDEAQDMTPLQWKLVRQWMEHMRFKVVVGDPDQEIYQFLGSGLGAGVFSGSDIPSENKRLLTKSYRVPRAAYLWSQQWISRVKEREEAPYIPTEVEGKVQRIGSTFQYIDQLMHRVEDTPENEKTMVLASCDYMLDELISVLRKDGVPYHNPYADNGKWNPLMTHRKDVTTTSDRVLAYLRPTNADTWWTGKELAKWTAMVKVDGILTYGAKEKIKTLPDRALAFSEIAPLFTEQGLNDAMSLNPSWMIDRTTKQQQRSLEYAVRIWQRYGVDGLLDEPRVILGTIHSVKGGEADHVVVFPDLSDAGYQEWQGKGRDAIRKLFYVAATRTRNTLTFCSPSSARSVEL